ncbi:importin subunit beta-2 [[Candida] railenensis]|uniref:Importin subunit beta-2 n=1 Tax=[Candida] railenensis TaxID=45579 RepID=A0A9P0QVI8_9ASCO|nr:importin subunit beta-2 [[Candida] railenensis]
MSWSPNPSALEHLQNILRATLSSSDNERRAANDELDSAKLQPEIENYLLLILIGKIGSVVVVEARSDIRASAGLILKNLVLKSDNVKERGFLLQHVLEGLYSDENMVRNITGNVITSLFSIYGYERWPEVIGRLAEMSGSTNVDTSVSTAAIGALAKISEDSASALDRDYGNGNHPLSSLIPQLLHLCDSSANSKVRAQAVHCLNQFVPLQSQSFLVHLDTFLGKLFQLASDSDSEVRRNVCTAFSSILNARADKLHPHLDGVINYCLHSMQDSDEDVAIEACEFLLALASTSTPELDQAVFKPKLALILPVLLEKMVYSEEDIFLMSVVDERDNAEVKDKDEDIKPQNVKAKTHTTETSKEKKKGNSNGSNSDDEDDDDYDDDSDSDDDDELSEWSLRKCAASTLDVLSINLPGEVLHVTLPILQERIVSENWPTREASILAFGAVSKSCMELEADKLPTLVPFLVERLQDQQPRVRQITCWTLSRYASWVCAEAHGEYSNFFQPTFQSVVTCALDPKKVVQEAACSALSGFIEEAESSVIQFYLGPLLEHFTKCFQTYQRKNMIILYDCVQTFIEKMGYEVLSSDPSYINALLPSLLEKWHSLKDDDTDLWPLLECMASVAATLQDLFVPYAVPVYARAINILSNCIQQDQQCQTNINIEPPEKDFMVTSLDLVDGLIQGFGSHSIELIQQNPANLMEILLVCLEDYTDDVRQSAYALLGDLAIFVMEPLVKPYFHSIFVSIGNEINNRTYNSFPVYNNAIWSLGEICMRLQFSDLEGFIPNLLDLLIPVMNSSDTQQTVLENASICLGRLGLTTQGAAMIAPRLQEFILQWCGQVLYLVDNNEKETAYEGMLNIINANPDLGFGGLSNQQGRKNLSIFIDCIGNYPGAPEELANKFAQILQAYRQMIGEEVWLQIIGSFDNETRRNLSLYGV